MKIKSADEIYKVVDKALNESAEPQTCAQLMERADVREAAVARFSEDVQIATNKLSDLLGFMWRRGILMRYQAPSSTSMARFAYGLAKHKEDAQVLTPIPPPVRLQDDSKPRFTITENDEGVTLEFAQVTIVIKAK